MALTAVVVSRNTAAGVSQQIPRNLLSVACAVDTNNNKGLSFTQASDQLPAAWCGFTADADIFFASEDSLTAANMRKLLAGQTHKFQMSPGQTVNFYIKTATTANVMPSIESGGPGQ